MTVLSLTLPTAGVTSNAVADPELVSAFTAIQTWANGNIDSSNLAPGVWLLTPSTQGSNFTATNGGFYSVAAGVSATLPSPATANQVVGIRAATGGTVSGATPVTVLGTAIAGEGLNGATNFTLGMPGAAVILQSDGAHWFIVSGRPDTGWVQMTNSTNVVGAAYARLVGTQVTLRGGLVNSTGGSYANGTVFATLPAGMAPWAAPAKLIGLQPGTGTVEVQVTSGHQLQTGVTGTWGNGQQLFFEGANYSTTF